MESSSNSVCLWGGGAYSLEDEEGTWISLDLEKNN